MLMTYKLSFIAAPIVWVILYVFLILLDSMRLKLFYLLRLNFDCKITLISVTVIYFIYRKLLINSEQLNSFTLIYSDACGHFKIRDKTKVKDLF